MKLLETLFAHCPCFVHCSFVLSEDSPKSSTDTVHPAVIHFYDIWNVSNFRTLILRRIIYCNSACTPPHEILDSILQHNCRNRSPVVHSILKIQNTNMGNGFFRSYYPISLPNRTNRQAAPASDANLPVDFRIKTPFVILCHSDCFLWTDRHTSGATATFTLVFKKNYLIHLSVTPV